MITNGVIQEDIVLGRTYFMTSVEISTHFRDSLVVDHPDRYIYTKLYIYTQSHLII